jgi:hypothetical protein
MISRRTVVRAAPGFLLALLLAGCVAIPTGGDVNTVTIDTEVDDVAQISLPDGPEPGQDMLQILEGFLRAGRGPQDDYRVAREFLAPGTEWEGTERVLISSSSISPVEVDGDTLTVTLTVAAEVDSTGRYVTAASQQTLTYDFTEVDGEMRISNAAPGTVLTPNGFTVAFEEYPLYFFDPSFNYLVPDLRWFPETRLAARRVVTELLGGPAPWLGSGVLISAFPAATTARVDYDAPNVTVDLSSDVRAESPRTQRRMLLQLHASLRALPNVSEQTIQVTAEGLALDPAPDSVPVDSRYLVSDTIGGSDGAVGTLTADGVIPLAGVAGRADPFEPRAAVLSRDRTSLAVLGVGGVTLIESGADPVLIDDRAGLVAPTIDPYGFVWTVPANNPGGLRAADASGATHPVALGADGRVVSVELSRDGARLLVALATSDGPRLFVAGVLRDADLAPVALGAAYELRAAGSIVDVAWVDGERVAVLTAADSGTTVHVLALGGPGENLGQVDGLAIVGGNLEAGIRVLTPDGSVLRPGAGNWVNTNLVASFLGTQQ